MRRYCRQAFGVRTAAPADAYGRGACADARFVSIVWDPPLSVSLPRAHACALLARSSGVADALEGLAP